MFLILEMGSSAVDSERTGVFLIGGLGSFGRIRTLSGLRSFCGLGKLGHWCVRSRCLGQQGIWRVKKKKKLFFSPPLLFLNKYRAAHNSGRINHYYCATSSRGNWCGVGVGWLGVCVIATERALCVAVRRVGGGMGGMGPIGRYEPRAALPGV